MEPIDLRSDTVTQPTDAMREAMMRAPLGDDVLGDEPTVRTLEERVAELLGKEEAVFTPSGTMANQIGIRVHTQPGDEIIAHSGSHIYHYETGAPAALSGCTFAFAEGPRGTFTPDDVDRLIRPPNHHFAPARLVCIENTHNKGGGAVWDLGLYKAVFTRAQERGLKRHLDGARIWNASAATGVAPRAYASHADTVSCCFSKGLGAPVGSALAGDRETIQRARRFRKMFGGAMRQAGVIAAGALYALDHNLDRLAEDHVNAKRLAEGLADLPGLRIDPATVETNIVYVELDTDRLRAPDFCEQLAERGVRVLPTGKGTVRAVTHLHITRAMIDEALGAVRAVLGETAGAGAAPGEPARRPPV